MLKDKEITEKFRTMASRFNTLYREKEYARAAHIYREALAAAMFLELPRETLSELFGYWEDDGTDDPAPQGLFARDLVHKANWWCCIRQHKTYQDEALRRAGEPVEYYSDRDYCAKHCRSAGQLPWR